MLPKEGIVIAHRDHLDQKVARASNSLFVVCLQVDRPVPQPFSNIHLLHNPSARLVGNLPGFYMPGWPQINLIPRDNARGSQFKNVAFIGSEENFAEAGALDEFRAALKPLNINFMLVPPKAWNDFSQFDAVLGVRSYAPGHNFLTKPALKLANAWLAGVPAVMGRESAYRATGVVGVNFLEADSRLQIVSCLSRLKDNAALRHGLVANGRLAAPKYSTEAVLERWMQLLDREIFPSYQRFRSSSIPGLKLMARARYVSRIQKFRPAIVAAK